MGGDYGPYIQTERLDIYRRYCRQLLDAGAAYRCFCTPERLEPVSKELQRQGLNPGYDRFCRDLDPDEAARRAAARREPHACDSRRPWTATSPSTT